MYIKKSILSGAIMTMGAILLAVLAILFCFTEIAIPRILYITAWIVCVVFVVEAVGRIER